MTTPAAVELTPKPWLSDLRYPEGMRWVSERLWFSDILGKKVRVADAGGSGSEELAEVPGLPSGLGFHPDGSLLIVSMNDCKILRRTSDGIETFADFSSQGWKYLNDMTIDPQTGTAYIDAIPSVEGESGAIVLVRPDGSTALAAKVPHPNGMVVLPGTRELVVSNTFGAALLSFAITADGTLEPLGTFATLPDRNPDGLCVDADAGVWTAAFSTGEILRVERGGRITHRVHVGEGRWALSSALGGPDGTTLFLASAVTTAEKWGLGEAEGWIDTVTAPVGAPS